MYSLTPHNDKMLVRNMLARGVLHLDIIIQTLTSDCTFQSVSKIVSGFLLLYVEE
jgi:hypothetical protein